MRYLMQGLAWFAGTFLIAAMAAEAARSGRDPLLAALLVAAFFGIGVPAKRYLQDRGWD